MKIKIVFSFIIVILTSVTLFAQKKSGQQSKEERRLEQQKQTEAMINDSTFVFEARMAYPQGGKSVSISTDGYYVKYSPALIQSILPFYGRAYSGIGYGGDQGVRFEGKPGKYTFEKTKKGYQVDASVNANNDLFNLSLTVGSEGNATLVINSNNRSSISFSGEISKPEVK